MAPWSSSRRGSQSQPNTTNTTTTTTTINNTNTININVAAANTHPNASANDLNLFSRIHNTALHTPTTLPGYLDGSHRFDIANANTDLSSDDDQLHPPPSEPSHPRRPQHGRSMSQPFPLLFTKKKKRQASASGPPPDLGFADDDAARANSSAAMPKQNPPAKSHSRGGPSGSKDFSTGTCMTCGSLVRWPKELVVFKCTICSSVNDTVPLGNEPQVNGGSKWRRDTNQGPPGAPPRVQYISIDQTKRLARQCIHQHLIRKLCEAPIERPNPKSRLSFSARMMAAGNGLGLVDPKHNGQPSDYVSHYVFDEEPTLRPNPLRISTAPVTRSYSSSHSERPSMRARTFDEVPKGHQRSPSKGIDLDPKRIFKQLEDYLIACFGSFECINSSFMAHHPRYAARVASEPIRRKPLPRHSSREREPREYQDHRDHRVCKEQPQVEDVAIDLDPKMLLIGDFAENGTWWTGQDEERPAPSRSPPRRGENQTSKPTISNKSPQINWGELMNWYTIVVNATEGWFHLYEELSREEGFRPPSGQELQAIEKELLQAQEHLRRTLLKATELLLKRPGRPMTDTANMRFLLIILENPLLYSDVRKFGGLLQDEDENFLLKEARPRKTSAPSSGPLSGQHSGIIKRVVGLISNSSPDCHNQLIAWFARYHTTRFMRMKDLVSGFLTYRMLRQSEKKQEVKVDITAGLIPQMQEGRSGAYLYDEISASRPSNQQKKQKEAPKKINYNEDWQIKAASRVLSLIFAANNLPHIRRGDDNSPTVNVNNLAAVREGVHASGQILPTSDFYNSLIDCADLVADFENWEARRGRFSFCQYPFLLSISAKTQILEHDARRQMHNKARDAFFDSIMSRRAINQFLMLKVRRECLVDDSLKAVSEVIGSGSEDIKKGLRIMFKGEEGIDGGGLRKEWFLLLVREVFNPDHGMFLYDEDSQYCYFNPNSFETSDQFFLVGVVMGLAIYNSTILDVALPPFAFRKLIASAPSHGTGTAAHPRPTMRYTLEDLAEYRPRLAKGLQQLLDYDGDVESTFCLDFVIDMDKYGTTIQAPLCPGGEYVPVTNSNRREYVDLYVRHVLDIAVTRQFEPFKRGFYTVCGGNALSLFRPEEIELLVRGSDEPLDLDSLRAVAEYSNWESKKPDETEQVVQWFWETFGEATPQDQRKLLLFITGSDRIPAMGAALLQIKISCLGDDVGRFPIARTCFNMISLWRYDTKEKLEKMLWTAVHESEGFGLK